VGSYGYNNWAEPFIPAPYDPEGGINRLVRVGNPSNTPLWGDCVWDAAGWPLHTEPFPHSTYAPGVAEGKLPRYCLARHAGGLHLAFWDGSVRRTLPTKLWGFEWSRIFVPQDSPP
jgi:prepilin-type processing-associated H-X9-DG protein